MRPDAGLLTVLILFLGIFLHLIPRLRKRNLYFGVTVAEEFRESEEGRAIARDFRVLTWTGTILAVAVCQAALSRQSLLLGNLTPQLQVAVAVVAWVRAWRRTRGHASQPTGVRSANLVDGQRASTGQILALALPLLGPVGAAVYLWSRYSELPARYPVHWNAAGHANRYVLKSPTAVFATPLISLTVLLLVLLVALGICFASRRGSSGEQPGWASKFRRLTVAMLTTIMWGISGLTTTLSLAPLMPADVMGRLTMVFVGALLVTVFAFGVPLIRMSMERTGGSDATPDSCWRGGAIYYNPDDPALMVERRDGIGYTINFGHRLSWVLIALIVAISILPALIVGRLK